MGLALPAVLLLGASAIAGALIAPNLYSPTSPMPRALSALEDRYRKAETLQATFLERYSENGTQVRVEAGKAYFLRPGKMRWEYEKPERDRKSTRLNSSHT